MYHFDILWVTTELVMRVACAGSKLQERLTFERGALDGYIASNAYMIIYKYIYIYDCCKKNV